MAKVTLDKVCKFYGDAQVVHDVSLDLPDKELVVLVGPSGCGKSTTLRMIAGLEEISSGTITIGERVVNQVAPKDRDIAMVFQSYALYPHMSVRRNLEFGLRMRGTPRAEIEQRVSEAASILGIDTLLERKPKDLSGGQRQRVAMGRAIVRRPAVFLFDEPLSNLDAKLRGQMRLEIARLHTRLKTTTVYVTHDQVEAMTLADRIVVMKDGWVQQVGAPLSIYEKPVNRFVAGFIGTPSMNFVQGEVAARGDRVVFVASGVEVPLRREFVDRLGQGPRRPVVLGIRPPDFKVMADNKDSIESNNLNKNNNLNYLKAKIDVREPMGAEIFLHVDTPWGDLVVRVDGHFQTGLGETIGLEVPESAVHLFDAETEKNLLA